MEQKLDFVMLSLEKNISFSELCKRFNISRPTGYKWCSRYKEDGMEGLKEQSRRPRQSPQQICLKIEDIIVDLRKSDPEWGPKKIHKLLLDMHSEGSYSFLQVPAQSTIGSILKRRGLINEEKSQIPHSWKRFEYDNPNELWQMDYKGEFLMRNDHYCYPLTVTDDHSRFNLVLQACDNQRYITVQEHLTTAFKQYGMPAMILCDNGSPWGLAGQNMQAEGQSITKLEKWMIRLNIKLIHGRPYHPQTQGKEERFHKTLKTELLNYKSMKDFTHCQNEFDNWRIKYNHRRPHEAIAMDVPAQRYQVSNRRYPDKLPDFQIHSGDIARKVHDGGMISFKGKEYRVGRALEGNHVAVRPSDRNNTFEVYYFNKMIRKIYL